MFEHLFFIYLNCFLRIIFVRIIIFYYFIMSCPCGIHVIVFWNLPCPRVAPCLCLCFLDGHIEGRNGGNEKKEEGKKLIVYYELFEISIEDSGRKARGVIVERSGVSPLRFGLGSKVLVLQGLEEFCKNGRSRRLMKSWEEGRIYRVGHSYQRHASGTLKA